MWPENSYIKEVGEGANENVSGRDGELGLREGLRQLRVNLIIILDK